ncbi:MAG: GNAT family N-acetyltransferase, partial [Ruminiclostridium sp.]|nr:GNAT family N-acetyltransferase [Ruminiclostridium sp.]
YAIYVLKEHYGRGAGYALMKTALSLMPEKKRFAVWVLKGNERAIRFYKKCGFIADGTEMTITLGTDVTEIRMVKENDK